MMRKNQMKAMSVVLCAALCASMSGAVTASAESDATIEVAYNLTTEDLSVFETLMSDFTEQTGIGVTIYNGGDDYESAMKTRMSSGDLPDVWVTHGWSLIRYSEYMMDLSDQDWVADIDSGLKDVITNDDGELFILPITQAVCGIIYNEDVLEAAGVDASEIRTWDDFTAACQAVTENTDAAAIEICCSDGFDSYSLEVIWPTLYTNSDVSNNVAEALQDGSFDWETDGTEGFQMLADWYNAGYMNEDCVSGQKDDIAKALANGEGAFTLYSTELIPSILAYNADANIGVMPAPSAEDGGASYFGTGEGNFSCFGIWKDTEYEDECKQLLEYLAQVDIAEQIVQIDGGIPALTTIELDEEAQSAYTATAFKAAQEAFDGDVTYDNFFDREYLPSGMWSVMSDATATMLADGCSESSLEDAVAIIAENYNDLMGN